MRNIILLATVLIIAAMIIKIYLRNSRYRERSTVIAHKGTRVTGSLVGIKHKNSFDHERNSRGKLIEMRIKYVDPHTGLEKVMDYYTTLGTAGLHPYIFSASGYIDTGAIAGALKAVKTYRKSLIDLGIQGDELKEAVKQYSLKISENPSRTMDENGYIVFEKNIPVNVYVLPEDGVEERKVHVEFLYDPKNNSDLFTVN